MFLSDVRRPTSKDWRLGLPSRLSLVLGSAIRGVTHPSGVDPWFLGCPSNCPSNIRKRSLFLLIFPTVDLPFYNIKILDDYHQEGLTPLLTGKRFITLLI